MPTISEKKRKERRLYYEMHQDDAMAQSREWNTANKERVLRTVRDWQKCHSRELKASFQKRLPALKASGNTKATKSRGKSLSQCAKLGPSKKKQRKGKRSRWTICKIVKEMLVQRLKTGLVIPKMYRRKGNALLYGAGQNVMEDVYVNRFLRAFRTRSYLKRKRRKLTALTRAKVIVRRAINKRIRISRKLGRKVEKLGEIVKTICQEGERKEANLEAFCGECCHTANSEPYFKEAAYDFNGSPSPKGDDSIENMLFGEEKKVRIEDIDYPCPGNEIKKALGHKMWKCDKHCLGCIHEQEYLKRLKRILSELSEIENADDMRKYFDDHDDVCSHKDLRSDKRMGHPKECYLNGCENDLMFLRQTGVHYPHMRTLVDALYRARRYDRKLMKLDCALIAGSKRLIALTKAKPGQVTEETRILPSEEEIAAMPCSKAFHKKIEDIPEFVCAACDTWHYRGEVTKVSVRTNSTTRRKEVQIASRAQGWNQLWNDLLVRYDCFAKEEDEFFLCGGCLEETRKGQRHHKRSLFNKLGVDSVPQELVDLNDVETTLIQRFKAYHTVVRLGTVSSKVPASDRLFVIKGQVLYYPLPIEESFKELAKAEGRPNHSQLCILVNGVPTKKKVIWQTLVNVGKVKRALRWLKNNNPLYEDINVETWLDPFWDELEGGDVSKDEMRQVRDFLKNHLQAHEQGEKEDVHLAVPQKDKVPMLKKVSDEEREYIMQNFSILPNDQKKPKGDDFDLYQMHRVSGPKMDNRAEKLDLGCYPKLFPRGRYGKYEKRTQQVTPQDFIRSRLLNKDGRFRRSASYIFSLLWDYELRGISPGIFQTLRHKRLGNVTAQGVLEKGADKDEQVEANLNTVFESMRGTKEYWDKRSKDLATMVRELGPFTFFVTLSAAEYDWEDMEKALIATNGDVPGIEKMRRGERCAMDPVTTAKHFHHRFLAFLNNVILRKEGGPLGVCKAYFWRREYQARGMSHYHMALWIEGAPRMGLDDDEVVAKYINDRITCQLPDPRTHPVLHRMVMKYQKHNCNKYCMRKKLVHHRWITKCRFSFPRPVRAKLVLNDATKTTAKRAAGSSAARLYELPRTEMETDINDYNPVFLLNWGANIDVQYVGESTGTVANYITGYITKAEKSSNEALWEEIEKSKTLRNQLYNYAFRKLSVRECGIVEAADMLLGHDCFGKSEVIKYINARRPADRYRNLKPYNDVQDLPEDAPAESLFQDDWMNTFYPNRPKKLEDVSLYEFYRWYDKARAPPSGLKFINKVPGGVSKRWKPCLISHKVFRGEAEEVKENHCYSLLLMFKPFRNETEDLIGEFGKASLSFSDEITKNEPMRIHHEKLQNQFRIQEEQDALRQKYIEALERNEDIDEEDEPTEPNDEDLYGRPVEMLVALDELEALAKRASQDEPPLERMIERMNEEQRELFDRATVHLDTETDAPIRIFTSGGGGVGKSYLISALRRWCENRFQTRGISVAIAAPSALAAHNVNGTTLHRLFGFGVQHGTIPPYNDLPPEVRKEMKTKLKDLKLMIIDEISMVSNVLLFYVHKRLCEIFGEDDENLFAGRNIVVFGDFTQLPPVKANPVFVPLSREDLKKQGCVAHSFDLWRMAFNDYVELNQSVRHKNDPEYAKIMENVRFQKMTETDVEVLLGRRIDLPEQKPLLDEVVDEYESILSENPNVICLVPTRPMVNAFNECMLKRQKHEVIELAADDTPKQKVSKKMLADIKKILQKRQDDVTDMAGIEPFLHVCIGARVLLRRNICVETGLVNGALGTVTGFARKDGKIEFVNVAFDSSPDTPAQIGRLAVDFKLTEQVYITRKQFPLILAYAMTIHKSQGLTFSRLMLDAGNKIFSAPSGYGMSYVGLSRVCTSAGLRLINFDPSKVKCNPACVDEINRLRGSKGEQISKAFTLYRRKNDRKWYEVPKEPETDSKGRKTTSKKKQPNMAKTTLDEEANAGEKVPKRNTRKRKAKVQLATSQPKSRKPTESSVFPDIDECPPFSPEMYAECNIENGMELCRVEPLPPGLLNPGQVCYSNSAMQSLMALRPFREMCKDLPQPRNLTQRYLVSFVEQYEVEEKETVSNTLSTKRIRSALANMGYPFGDDALQQCAFEFVQGLLRASHLSLQFEVTTRRKYECTFGGDTHRWERDQSSSEYFLQMHPETHQTLSDSLAPWEPLPEMKCEQCNQVGRVNSSDCIVEVGRFLLIWIMRYATVQVNRTPIPGFDADKTIVNGKPFKLMAAIEHIGANYMSGHYVAYIRRDQKWFKCNDETVTEVGGVDPELRTISFLILERIPPREPINVNID